MFDLKNFQSNVYNLELNVYCVFKSENLAFIPINFVSLLNFFYGNYFCIQTPKLGISNENKNFKNRNLLFKIKI